MRTIGGAVATAVEIPASHFIRQNWNAYTPEQHEVWRTLYARRMTQLNAAASQVWLTGAETIGLREDSVPNLAEVNARLSPKTGWRAVPVDGYLDPKYFFAMISQRQFPTTVTVRPKEKLDYLPEPDIFHDVFGHVPLHADPIFADFLARYGEVALHADTPEAHTAMTRLFWFTVEFGLVREAGQTKVYGSGLISSHADCLNALGPNCDRRPFTLDAVINQPFEIDHIQPILFEVDSFEQLFLAVEEARERLRIKL